MKRVLVCGAGGFIGNYLVDSLKAQGHYVIGADIKFPLYSKTNCDKFYSLDLRERRNLDTIFMNQIDEVYQLAADMGGAAYVFSGDYDAEIMHNSVLINLNVLDVMVKKNVKKVFYSSSACMYPSHNQEDPNNPNCSEASAYPANPDSEYGWEKMFSERMYLAYARNYGLDVRIARFHNVFGPKGSWNNGKEKAPAALCRKVLESNGEVEVWGPGTQTRSFLFVDECVEGIHRMMANDYNQPLNLGSTRMISINDLVLLIAKLGGKTVTLKNVPGPLGVMGRNSDNTLIQEKLGWAPKDDLEAGLLKTYNWIKEQIEKGVEDEK